MIRETRRTSAVECGVWAAVACAVATVILWLIGCAAGAGTGTTNPVAPAIATQPQNASVAAGQTATFTIVATGTAPLSYQWQKNQTNIAGATSASYTTPAAVTGDNNSTFRVIVSNGVQPNATSNSATLTVTASPVAPTITAQPQSLAVTIGQTATFTVVAAGTAPLSYQWQKNQVNISGATSASYTTPATILTDSGAAFRVIVSNGVQPNAPATPPRSPSTRCKPIASTSSPITTTMPAPART